MKYDTGKPVTSELYRIKRLHNIQYTDTNTSKSSIDYKILQR